MTLWPQPWLVGRWLPRVPAFAASPSCSRLQPAGGGLRLCLRPARPDVPSSRSVAHLPVMSEGSPRSLDGWASFMSTTSEPADAALRPFWDLSCLLLDCLDAVTLHAKDGVAAAGDGSVEWDSFVLNGAALDDTLAKQLKLMLSSIEDLPVSSSMNTRMLLEAVAFTGALRTAIATSAVSLASSANEAMYAALSCAASDTARKKRIFALGAWLRQCLAALLEFKSILAVTAKELDVLYFNKYPIAVSLARSQELLQPGRQRSPGSILTLVPGREDAVCIRRDTEVVKALTHVVVVSNARVGSVVAASPGVGKSHWVWDVVEALGSLEDPRYALAAEGAGLSAWPGAVGELQGARPCVVTFNSGSLWGKLDKTLIEEFSMQPGALFLPLYLRVLWCLRCVDGLDWASFVAIVLGLLGKQQTTASAIISEALAALKEQRIIVIVEELNKIDCICRGVPVRCPAEDECSDYDGWSDNTSSSHGGVSLGSNQGAPIERQMLLDVYRHELCTWTGLAQSLVSLLFTSVSFGMIYAEVKYLLTNDEQRIIDEKVASLKRVAGVVNEAKTWLTSTSSSRRGSPYFVLCAVDLSPFGTDQLADAYFRPIFDTDCAIRTSLPQGGSYLLRSDRAARALARLCAGHARSAGFLRQQLKLSRSGPVWSTVVTRAVSQLAQDGSLAVLLEGLLVTPVVITAALHNCTLDSRQPVSTGAYVAGPCASWDDLLASNALTASAKDSSGTYQNPCMPPLYLVALLEQWKAVRANLAARHGSARFFKPLQSIFNALEQLLGASDAKGAASHVWEFVSLYSDVVLTRVRAAALTWGASSPGFRLPHDYRAVTLLQLYPGTQAYYSEGERPLIKHAPYNAVAAVSVNDKDADNTMAMILRRPARELGSTVFKCRPEQLGFDCIKFLGPGNTTRTPMKSELVAVCKSSKYTGSESRYIDIDTHVRGGLAKLKAAFGSLWEEWSGRVVFVVETNLQAAQDPKKLLTADESAMVIIITRNDHQAVYGRALSGFIGDGPALYHATLEPLASTRLE